MTIKAKEHEINGLRLPVLEGGDTHSKEAIVFIHGFPGSARDWQPYLEMLSPLKRVVALNMPGFGDADKPAAFNYTVESYLPLLTALFEKMAIEKIHFVLHDFGGAWGLNWAAQNSERIKSISLINTGLFLPKWHSLAKLFRTPVLGELFSLLPPVQSAFDHMISCNGANRLSDTTLKYLKNEMDYGTRRAMMKLYRNTQAPDASHKGIAQLFAAQDLPAMVIWGEDDPYLPVAMAHKQKAAFPNAHVHIIKECGHWPFFEKSEETKALLLGFYEELFVLALKSVDR